MLPARLAALLFLLPAGCSTSSSPAAIQDGGEAPRVEAPAEPTVAERLEAHVRALAGREVPRSAANPDALDEVAELLHEQLEACGGRVRYQPFEVEGTTYRNVVARMGPAEGAPLVLGAHYDVCGELPGADDNASGVAVLLEIARQLQAEELERPLELVAYTLEEPPYFGTEFMGSVIHARALKKAGVTPRGVIAFDMLGYFSDEPDSQSFPLEAMKELYSTTADFLAVVGRPQDKELAGSVHEVLAGTNELPYELLLAPRLVTGVDFSDHASYWDEGMSAVMLTDSSFYRNDRYHTDRDTPETLDYERMALAVEGLVKLVREL